MQVVAIIIFGGIALFFVGLLLSLFAEDFWKNVAGILTVLVGGGALISGIVTFLCLILYALGNKSPELSKAFTPTVTIFVICVTILYLIGKTGK